MKMNEDALYVLFAAGALSAAEGRLRTEKDAEAFVGEAVKQAARRVRWDDEDDEDDEKSTWWSRNKHWALPTAIGAGAFILGGDAGRNGRPDRSYLSNAGSLLWERVQALLGFPNSDLWRSVTETPRIPAATDVPAAGEESSVPPGYKSEAV